MKTSNHQCCGSNLQREKREGARGAAEEPDKILHFKKKCTAIIFLNNLPRLMLRFLILYLVPCLHVSPAINQHGDNVKVAIRASQHQCCESVLEIKGEKVARGWHIKKDNGKERRGVMSIRP